MNCIAPYGRKQAINIGMNTGTHNDFYRWGWDDGWFNAPPTVDSTFKVSFVTPNNTMPLRDELMRASYLIANRFDKPLLVCLSGGLDSQIVCLALKEAQVPFTPFIMNWKAPNGDLINHDDVQFAHQFCAMHGWEPLTDTAYLEEFLAEKGRNAARSSRIQHYRMLTQIHYADRFKDTHAVIICAGNPSFDVRDGELFISAPTSAVQQYFIDHDVQGSAQFLKYTSELFCSQVVNKIGLAFIGSFPSLYSVYEENSKTPWWSWRLFTSYVKPLIYQANWGDGLIHRSKKHGFETYDDSFWKAEIHRIGSEAFGHHDNEVRMKIGDFMAFAESKSPLHQIWHADGRIDHQPI